MAEVRNLPGADGDPRQLPVPPVQRWSAVLWPSFLLAGAANAVFFTALDPQTLLDCHGGAPAMDRTAAYSLGFFLFWLLAAASSFATSYYLMTRVPPSRRQEFVEDEDGDDPQAR